MKVLKPKTEILFQINLDAAKLWATRSLGEQEAAKFVKSVGNLPTQIYTPALSINDKGELIIKHAFHAGICADDQRPVRILYKKPLAPLLITKLPKSAIIECNLPEWANIDEVDAEIQLSDELHKYEKGQHPQELILTALPNA